MPSSFGGYLECEMGVLWNWTSLPCHKLLKKTLFPSPLFLPLLFCLSVSPLKESEKELEELEGAHDPI